MRPIFSPMQREAADAWMTAALERVGWPADRNDFSPAEVVELLAKHEYAVGPGTLAEFTRKGYVPDPGPTWSRLDVFFLIGHLEGRRRWAPTPSVHDCKKSADRLAIERARADGRPVPIANFDAVTIEDVLLLLVESDLRERREGLYEILRLKLEGFEE